MTVRKMTVRALTLASVVSLALGGVALAQDSDEAAMMQAWQAAMTPGEAHQTLASMAGNWSCVIKSYDDPENPQEFTGTTSKNMIMGGRYLRDMTEGTMMGMPFNGMGLTGYNNVTGEYESLWLDNMSTGMTMAGTGKLKENVMTMHADYVDPMTKEKSKAKWVTTIVDENNHTFAWYSKKGGKDVKVMEILYTRK